jgi:transcriptional regulator of acetoin/glycerol metabolism
VFALTQHTWPGNVREVQAVVDEAVLHHSASPRLEATEEILARLRAAPSPAEPVEKKFEIVGHPSDAQLETMLEAVNGSVTALAHKTGVGRATLYRWIKARGIDPRMFRRRGRRT